MRPKAARCRISQPQAASRRTTIRPPSSFAPRRIGSAIAAVLLIGTALGALAQGKPEQFKARLAPLGVTGATVNTTTGSGTATATLDGSRLTVQGTFAGLTGAATAANVRRGPKAIPGPIVFELEFTKASSGTVKGSFELNAAQIEDAKGGRLYIQIHSERAPDGSIRGWLLK